MSKVHCVKLDKIDVPPSLRDPDSIEPVFQMLKLSIEQDGLRNPVTLMPQKRTGFLWFLKEKRYLIVDGQMRLRAVKELGTDSIPAFIVKREDYRKQQLFLNQI